MCDKKTLSGASKLALLSIFLAYALIMGFLERLIPFDFAVPGIKLGLANVVTLTALYIFPAADAFKLVALKCVMTAFFAGSGLSFFYSTGGALLSFAVMVLMLRLLGAHVGAVGVSVTGAVFHNIGQLLVAAAVMRTLLVASYLPALAISGVITGVIVGYLTEFSVSFIRRCFKI